MTSSVRDLIVGLFVIAGLAAIAYLSIALGGLNYSVEQPMPLVARFDEIAGLNHRAQVVIGGVRVGQVEAIELDEDFRARVHIKVEADLKLPDDTGATIITAGVLGNKYLALEPGASEDMLGPGDEIAFTQNAIVLEKLIGRLIQSFGAGDEE